MRRLRQLKPGAWWSVTVRCARAEFRLRPDEERTNAVGFFLAKALTACPGVKLAAVTQMSNHIHLVLRDDASELSNFMCRFEGPLAKSLNKLDTTRGQVFERRFSAIEAIDEDAVLDRIAYAAMNPVQAGLVRKMQDWPGLLVWPGERKDLAFGREPPRGKPESYALTLAHDLFTPEEVTWLKEEIEQRTAEVHRERGDVPFLGPRRVLAQNVFDAPAHPKRSRMPL
ncbi:MAG: hypothetical protein AAF851_21260, partial [Myxococcota bacterium]